MLIGMILEMSCSLASFIFRKSGRKVLPLISVLRLRFARGVEKIKALVFCGCRESLFALYQCNRLLILVFARDKSSFLYD